MIRRLIKDIGKYGAADFAFRLLAFFTFPIYAHVFKVAEFGVMALVTSLAGLVSVINTMGMSNAVQRFYWDESYISEEDQPSLVSTGLVIQFIWSLIITTVVLILLFPLKELIKTHFEVAYIYLFLALLSNIFNLLITYCIDAIRLHLKPSKYILLVAINNVLTIGLSLYFVVILHMGLYGYFLGMFIGLTIVSPLAIWLIKKDITLNFNKEYARELVKYGYPFIFAGLAYWVFGSMDRWMLGEFSTIEQVGLYSIAFKFATILTFLNKAFGLAWSPLVMKIVSEDKNYRKTFSRIFTYWFFFIVLIGVGISVFGYEGLVILTPKGYHAAALIIAYVVMGIAIQSTTQITVLGISLEKQTHYISRASWITAVINLVFNLILIPIFGALGAAIATLISYIVLTSLYLWWSQQLHPIPIEKRKIVAILGIVLTTLIFVTYVDLYPWSILMLLIKVGYIALVIGVAFMIKIINFEFVTELRRKYI